MNRYKLSACRCGSIPAYKHNYSISTGYMYWVQCDCGERSGERPVKYEAAEEWNEWIGLKNITMRL